VQASYYRGMASNSNNEVAGVPPVQSVNFTCCDDHSHRCCTEFCVFIPCKDARLIPWGLFDAPSPCRQLSSGILTRNLRRLDIGAAELSAALGVSQIANQVLYVAVGDAVVPGGRMMGGLPGHTVFVVRTVGGDLVVDRYPFDKSGRVFSSPPLITSFGSSGPVWGTTVQVVALQLAKLGGGA